VERLYLTDSYRTTFRSRVTAIRPAGSSRSWVRLQETLFYPTSGGQPHDTGMLGNAPVVDVELEGGAVWHLIEGQLDEGSSVEGAIDWPRRYRHMQRHSAQHLLSQAFVRLSPAFATRSVALLGAICTLDLTGDPDEQALQEAEALVNEVAYRNLPIRAFEVDESELARYPLRRAPKVRGRVRLVAMGDWELSACGGTHLARTAEALPIKLLRLERIRGGLRRVHFCAGLEALEDYALKHRVSYSLAVALSTQVGELPAKLEQLTAQRDERGREVVRLQRQLAELTAVQLLQAAGDARPRVVSHHLGDAALLGPLADALVAQGGVVALLSAEQDGRTQLLFARSEDVPYRMNELLQTTLEPLGGRGGGREAYAQGSLSTIQHEVLARAKRCLRDM
jgi:alanyl-tRNA synthetase